MSVKDGYREDEHADTVYMIYGYLMWSASQCRKMYYVFYTACYPGVIMDTRRSSEQPPRHHAHLFRPLRRWDKEAIET